MTGGRAGATMPGFRDAVAASSWTPLMVSPDVQTLTEPPTVPRVDPLTPEQRSRQMSLVRGKHTRPEKAVRAALSRLGYRYRLHPADVPGRPDVVVRRLRAAIFVHGCFWHRHSGCPRTRVPKTRVDYWTKRFSDNAARDRTVQSQLRCQGWRTLVVWECASERPQRLEALLRTFLGDCS